MYFLEWPLTVVCLTQMDTRNKRWRIQSVPLDPHHLKRCHRRLCSVNATLNRVEPTILSAEFNSKCCFTGTAQNVLCTMASYCNLTDRKQLHIPHSEHLKMVERHLSRWSDVKSIYLKFICPRARKMEASIQLHPVHPTASSNLLENLDLDLQKTDLHFRFASHPPFWSARLSAVPWTV